MPTNLQFASDLSDALRHVLREARESQVLSLGEVATRSGLNRQAITFIEKGDRRPSTETLSRLAMALGMKPSEVWAKAEARMPPKQWKQMLTQAVDSD